MTPRAALERYGVLLLSDNARPAVAQLVAGGPIKGSWWGHAKGKQIFAIASALEDEADVTTAKLVDRKVTFVHRRLWPAIVAVGAEGGRWQTDGLSTEAADLLADVGAKGRIASDDPLPWDGKTRKQAFGQVGERLLCAMSDEHTERGSHRTVAERWADWAARRGVVAIDAAAGRAELEAAIAALGGGRAPWG